MQEMVCAGLKLRFYTYNFGVFLTVSVSKQLNVNAPEVGPPPSAVSKLPETIFRWHLLRTDISTIAIAPPR